MNYLLIPLIFQSNSISIISIVCQQMDSIFQIKINENKLQKILNELSLHQFQQHQQLQKIQQSINQQKQIDQHMKKEMIVKIETIGCKVHDYMTGIEQKIQNLQEVTKNIQKKSLEEVHSTIEKIKMIQQHNGNKQQYIQGFKKDVYNQFKKITQIIEKNQFSKTEKIIAADQQLGSGQKPKGLLSNFQMRINTLQKQVSGTNKLLQILEDENLLYFLHYLVDKETGIKTVAETMKQNINPFNNGTQEEKMKRYNELKSSLLSTQNKMEDMKLQYVGLYRNNFYNTKQNREENHLHYALLSTKIKQLQNRLNQQQMKIMNPDQAQKILYPTPIDTCNTRQKNKTVNKGMRSQNSFENKYKQASIHGSTTEFQKFQFKMLDQNSKILERLTTAQDKIWSACNKVQQIKESSKLMKSDVDKISEKIKIFNHYSQFGGEKDMLNFKTIGQFIYQFRSIEDNIEQKIKHMVDIKNFNKNIQQITQKVKIVNEVVEAKANKDQTRRAFNFIQEKIKEIVTLIANMQSSHKKAAGRKKLMQCMSCDDNFFEDTQIQKQIYDVAFNLTRATTSRTPSNFNIKCRQRGKQKIQI